MAPGMSVAGHGGDVRNIHSGDRIARLLLGLVILGLYGALPGPWRYLTLMGLMPLASGLTGFGPVRAWRERKPVW